MSRDEQVAASPSPRYRTIVADPPWQIHQPPQLTGAPGFAKVSGRRQYPAYPTMAVDEIAALPVSSHTAADCHLYLWTINRYIEDAYDVARAWGFTPSTLLVWCKTPRGVGAGGAYALTTEYVLFARKGRGAYVQRHPTSWFSWTRGKPSAKPEAFQDIVEQVSPGPYLELFARRKRPGWDVWGDEVESDVEIVA